MKKVYVLIAALISLTGSKLFASQGTTIFLEKKETLLGYGGGTFPNGE